MLAEFDETFGFFASDQISIRVDDLSRIERIMAALRERHPSAIGGLGVERVEDLLAGRRRPAAGDVLRLWLVDGSRVIVRPSGTEPKLKVYLDVRGDSADDAQGAHQRALERRRDAALLDERSDMIAIPQ